VKMRTSIATKSPLIDFSVFIAAEDKLQDRSTTNADHPSHGVRRMAARVLAPGSPSRTLNTPSAISTL
jgi:hypothetical protein